MTPVRVLATVQLKAGDTLSFLDQTGYPTRYRSGSFVRFNEETRSVIVLVDGEEKSLNSIDCELHIPPKEFRVVLPDGKHAVA